MQFCPGPSASDGILTEANFYSITYLGGSTIPKKFFSENKTAAQKISLLSEEVRRNLFQSFLSPNIIVYIRLLIGNTALIVLVPLLLTVLFFNLSA